MSNQINHRRGTGKNNARKDERPTWAGGCGGEGHNGQIGRSKWKKISRRNERRAIKEGRTPRIKKYGKKRTFKTKEHFTMFDGVAYGDRGRKRTVLVPKPIIVDKIEDEY